MRNLTELINLLTLIVSAIGAWYILGKLELWVVRYTYDFIFAKVEEVRHNG